MASGLSHASIFVFAIPHAWHFLPDKACIKYLIFYLLEKHSGQSKSTNIKYQPLWHDQLFLCPISTNHRLCRMPNPKHWRHLMSFSSYCRVRKHSLNILVILMTHSSFFLYQDIWYLSSLFFSKTFWTFPWNLK